MLMRRLWNMLDLKVKAGILAALLLLVGVPLMTASSGADRVTGILNAAGFSTSQSEDTRMRPGNMTIGDISLDADGFSMIGELKANGGPLFPLFGAPKHVTIKNLQLTGEWNEELGLSFAGWTLPRVNTGDWGKIERIVLEDGIIDLDTPAGALRLGLKGETARHPDDPRQQVFYAHLSGAQHQLVLDSQIKGRWDVEKGLSLESEIREARLHLDSLDATRVTGWIAMETQKDSPVPVLSGQIQAGQFARGNLKLNNVTLTLDGALTAPHIILNAELGGYNSAALLMELQSREDGNHILASVETTTLDDMLSLLAEFRTQAETSPSLQESLMALLITEGNIERIKQDLKKDDYGSYILEIEGLSHDLKGKIIARKIRDGVMQREVFSLNPSIAAGG